MRPTFAGLEPIDPLGMYVWTGQAQRESPPQPLEVSPRTASIKGTTRTTQET